MRRDFLMDMLDTENDTSFNSDDFQVLLKQNILIAKANSDLIITSINAFSRLIPENWIGKTITELFDLEKFHNEWLLLSEGDTWRGQGELRLELPIQLNLTLTKVAEDTYIVFGMDVTEVIETIEEDVEAEYKQKLQHTLNGIFTATKPNEHYLLSVIGGKLLDKLQISSSVYVMDGSLEWMDDKSYSTFTYKLDEAFKGNEQVFKHTYDGVDIYTLLSPIEKDGEIVEVLGTLMDITSFEESQKQVSYLATHDALTGLPNRLKLLSDLENFINEDLRSNLSAVIICDLDRLKTINDTYGQLIGDQVIEIAARRLKEIVSEPSILYRLGGDEFVIIYRGTDGKVEELLEEMLHYIRQPIFIQNKDLYITATAGVYYYDHIEKRSDELINRASIAVHYGKIKGGNNIFRYNDTMSKKYNELLLVESDLRKAFQLNEFRLHYQPKVDVDTNKIVGVEALIRWNHGKKGNIPPSLFIPVAEEIGMIQDIDEWVLEEACNQFNRWVSSGVEPIMIAVNVSATELQQADFLDRVRNIIEKTGMDPNYLEIEITENSILYNTEECIDRMRQLREMGISLAIDDFGTGYSSMGYLPKFPINFLKIDQSFIRDICNETGNEEIIKAMIQLAHTFGLKVVAEGVEQETALSFIKNEKCDYYQGYFFSRPLEAEVLEQQLLLN
ncbi:diguanylate cyclase (GGDEF)-like protein [Gracilibacillus halotolerans]|uniref:Diguanylate cyclase (GGDEF)-like protein n=1 Tax=Gracilibacillus halotolerans TaxID=74386 RepID=A0A841RM14_9BACI|nr:bifunctional diguanylate cyclase/phosphodiesterase [Gracilibacillus halotolerans]MBB6513539.1 diguanylate cyclase (GGDEF)-like protein [Gracilibacillus halotolerans]